MPHPRNREIGCGRTLNRVREMPIMPARDNGEAFMRRTVLVVAVAAWTGLPAAAGASTGERLQAVVDEVVAGHALVPGAALHVDAPRAGLPWGGAGGRTAHAGGTPLRVDDPFRIASTMKIFTAAAILRLVEDGRLRLDDPVAPFLDADQVDTMHVHEGVNHGRRITIRHLLTHTSGLNGHDNCELGMAAIALGRDRRWTPREQIQMMIDCGDPKFAPGAPGRWSYSDTGYIMLGSVLAKATGRDFPGALRELLPLRRLGLEQTWHELLEPVPRGMRPRAHQYVAALDMTDWNPSFDSWGGGGYASTVGDLTRFMRGLFEHRVFRHRRTLELMKTWMPITPGPQGIGSDGYGMGLAHFTFDGIECWGHPGFWSSIAMFCPALDLALAGTTNQAQDEHEHAHTEGFLSSGAVLVVRDADPVRPSLRAWRSGRRVMLEFRAGDRPLAGATVRVLGRELTTGADGRVILRTRRRRFVAHACKTGVGCASLRFRAPAVKPKTWACGAPRCSPSS